MWSANDVYAGDDEASTCQILASRPSLAAAVAPEGQKKVLKQRKAIDALATSMSARFFMGTAH
jgi:hypothetical protein